MAINVVQEHIVSGCHDYEHLVEWTTQRSSACADDFFIKLLLSKLFTSKSVLVDAVGRCHNHELWHLVKQTAHAQMIFPNNI